MKCVITFSLLYYQFQNHFHSNLLVNRIYSCVDNAIQNRPISRHCREFAGNTTRCVYRTPDRGWCNRERGRWPTCESAPPNADTTGLPNKGSVLRERQSF